MAMSIEIQNDVVEEINQKDREFERNVYTRDGGKLCRDLYAEDAKLLPPNTGAIVGRAAIQDFWQSLLDVGLADVSLDTTEVEQVGDIAYALGTYHLAIRPQGADGVQDSGKYVYIYKRQPDGSWKALVDIFNSDLPAS
jgi:ketosteroid isomerase-like protein